jgi:hypothetical protein
MQRPRTRGATADGETKRRATQQSPRRQTAMMARHFNAGRCANALIPTLGLDASTPAAPFKCSLLDALGTSLSSSSTTSSSDIFSSHGSLCLLRRCRICELGGETSRAPPGQQEQNKGSYPVDGRSEQHQRSTGAWRQQARTLATEGFGAATRGGTGQIECRSRVDPRVLVLCNQRRRPGWSGLAGIGAGRGGDVGVEQGRERGDSGAEVLVGTDQPSRSGLVSQPSRPVGPVQWTI